MRPPIEEILSRLELIKKEPDSLNYLAWSTYEAPRHIEVLCAYALELEDRQCSVCNDTGKLDDAQAWDCGQEASDCPYCPSTVDKLLTRLRAAEGMAEALELVENLRGAELGRWLLTPNAKYPTLAQYVREALAAWKEAGE